MAYSELIKNFDRIRDYMREFYVYGFKSRDEFEKKSARSYDNEKRRIESYLGDYMGFKQTRSGKNVFISIDSRRQRNNPLYKALKAKSFTDKDITLHFILLDILYSEDNYMSINEIADSIEIDYLTHFKEPMQFDESTIRKKIKEYCELGIIKTEKKGNKVLYSRADSFELEKWRDAIGFFSEAGIGGVVGNFILDKMESTHTPFLFKHHYITHALESEILSELLEAISNRNKVIIKNYSQKTSKEKSTEVVPLKIFVSTQNGRSYLLAYRADIRQIKSYRLDYIIGIKTVGVARRFDELRNMLEEKQKHMWGVICNKKDDFEHVEFTIHIDDGEEYIFKRLEREKRCGRVERINKNTCRFTADVYDSGEMIPWIRTFTCRIASMNFSNRTTENRLKADLEEMYRMYNIEDSVN